MAEPSRVDVSAAAFFPRQPVLAFGSRLASDTNRFGIRLWNVETRQEVGELPVGRCVSIAVSQDEQMLLAWDDHGTLSRWRLSDGTNLSAFKFGEQLPGAFHRMVSLAFSQDGRRAALTSDVGSKLWLIDLEAGKPLWPNPVSTGVEGRGLAFTPDGKRIALGTAFGAGAILLFDADTGNLLRRLEGHRSLVSSLLFLPDGQRLASASYDQQVGLWDLRDLSNVPQPRMFRGHTLEVWALALLADGKTLVSGSKNGEICLWDLNAALRDPMTASRRLARQVSWALAAAEGVLPGVDLASREWVEWDVASGSEQRTPILLEAGARRTCWSADGRFLAVGGTNGAVQVWEHASRQLVQQFQAGTREVVPLQFHENGRQLAMAVARSPAGWDFKIWTVNPARQELSTAVPQGLDLFNEPNYPTLVWGLAAELSQVVLVGKAENSNRLKLTLWRPAQARFQELPIEGEQGELVTGISFSPAGDLVAISSISGATHIFETSSGRRVTTLRGFFTGVFSVTFSPDGRRLAVGAGGEAILKIYDVATWRELIALPTDGMFTSAIGFSSDGEFLRARVDHLDGEELYQVWRVPGP